MKKSILILLVLGFLNSISQTIHQVNAGSFYYNPENLTIDIGDSVIWVNDGGMHDVNGNISSINGQSFNNPVSFSSSVTNVAGAIIYAYKFTVSGIYNYDCSVGYHAVNGMVGTITVNNTSTGSLENKVEPEIALVFDFENNELIVNYKESVPLEGTILIHGIDGKLINNDKFFTFNNRVKINHNFKRGTYIFTVVLKDKIFNSKFIF